MHGCSISLRTLVSKDHLFLLLLRSNHFHWLRHQTFVLWYSFSCLLDSRESFIFQFYHPLFTSSSERPCSWAWADSQNISCLIWLLLSFDIKPSKAINLAHENGPTIIIHGGGPILGTRRHHNWSHLAHTRSHAFVSLIFFLNFSLLN